MDALPAALDPRLAARARSAAEWVRAQVRAQREVAVVHHIDADGVTAGAIAAECLHRAGARHRLLAVKSLDEVGIALVHAAGSPALWLCDLGSTAYMHFPQDKLVCDHHQLVRDGGEELFPHVNPLLDGIPGDTVSGAGCCFLVAAALSAQNADLRPLALVGAAADRQDRPTRGTNLLLQADAVAAGQTRVDEDLAFYGHHTRPLRKLLTLASDPTVPGISGDGKACERLLRDAGADPDALWCDLEEPARRAVRSALAGQLLDIGLGARVPDLFRPVVTLLGEPPGPTREPREFGTLLNSTARYGRADVGLAVARGNRGTAYAAAMELLLDHRRHLVGALGALAASPVGEGVAIQHVHLRDRVLDTVVGIVAGMALGGDMGLRRDMPLLAFAWTPDGRTKASARAPPGLVTRGLDLATALRDAAAGVGGQGGGHPGAAGATIPRSAEEAFLRAVDSAVAVQTGRRPSPPPARIPARTGQSSLDVSLPLP